MSGFANWVGNLAASKDGLDYVWHSVFLSTAVGVVSFTVAFICWH